MALSNPFSKEYSPYNNKPNSGRRKWILRGVIAAIIIIALAVGLGVGLSLKNKNGGNEQQPPTPPTNGTWWKPSKGMTWQIILNNSSIGTSNFDPVQVYDIDLFDNPSSTISSLRTAGKKVICYFSAGSYEDWRPDASQFPSSAMGNKLDNWPGEKWINTNDPTVRGIMAARMDMAVQKGCDAVDPDNIDAYDNNNGLSLTMSDAINYVTYLATEAHSRGLACGLKNGGKIVSSVLNIMDFEVNEQCVQFNECNKYTGFITQGKPVFHIEYPSDTSVAGIQSFCQGANTSEFSTIIKHMGLNEFSETC